jgi:hypothetical protein
LAGIREISAGSRTTKIPSARQVTDARDLNRQVRQAQPCSRRKSPTRVAH